MKLTTRLFPILLLLTAGAALAQIDPDPDGIGIYFDTGATEVCKYTPTFQVFTAYVCLTHPSGSNGVAGWAGRVETPPVILQLAVRHPVLSRNIGEAPDFIVGYSQSIPSADVVVLMEIDLMAVDEQPVVIRLDHADGQPACYADGADPRILIPMYPSSGSWASYVAVVNGDCDVIANEDFTWGRLKALYDSGDREVTP